jgi:hypothetical protein
VPLLPPAVSRLGVMIQDWWTAQGRLRRTANQGSTVDHPRFHGTTRGYVVPGVKNRASMNYPGPACVDGFGETIIADAVPESTGLRR